MVGGGEVQTDDMHLLWVVAPFEPLSREAVESLTPEYGGEPFSPLR